MPATVSGAPCSQAQVNGLVEEALPQGCWSDDDYLWLTDRTRRLVEFADGYLEILPMPTRRHQRILAFLYSAFRSFLQPLGGEVLFAPLRLRVRPGKFREPDLLLLRDAQDGRSGDRYWTGADLVAEVVSPDNPQRDLVAKRLEYADAGVAEYWIVDPGTETVTVLGLEDGNYVERSACHQQGRACSRVLAGFAVDVGELFAVDSK